MARRPLIALAAPVALVVGLLIPLVVSAPAEAAARVSVTNSSGAAIADPDYATTLTVSGRGFQSIKGGYGGIYVVFGTVKGTWRPSQGGQTGRDYFYLPDSESKDNQGYQKFVSFPGGDTADAANGGVVHADGTWRTTLKVPGARFQTLDRNGKATTIDCRKMTCGVITIGAHGVTNAKNETFTKVSVESLSGTTQPTPTATASADPAGVAEMNAAGVPTVPTLVHPHPRGALGGRVAGEREAAADQPQDDPAPALAEVFAQQLDRLGDLALGRFRRLGEVGDADRVRREKEERFDRAREVVHAAASPLPRSTRIGPKFSFCSQVTSPLR